jgi:hypothetical protein
MGGLVVAIGKILQQLVDLGIVAQDGEHRSVFRGLFVGCGHGPDDLVDLIFLVVDVASGHGLCSKRAIFLWN